MSGSAGYALADNEREIVQAATGRRWRLTKREHDFYRVLALCAGHWLRDIDLLYCVYGEQRRARCMARIYIWRLRRKVGPGVVEQCNSLGYMVSKAGAR